MKNSFRIVSLISLIILSLICVNDLSATRVAGNVSGAWTAEGNPYDVVADITLPSGQELTIGAGVQIRFISGSRFNVLGKLLANGELGDSILFRANNGQIGDYRGIIFEGGGSNESVLNYTIITQAYQGVHFLRSAATINNSRISHHQATCIRFEASTGSVLNSSITNSENSGILIEARSRPTVRGCSIWQQPDNGIIIKEESGGTVSGNTIIGVGDHGIAVSEAGVCSLAFNTISGSELNGIYVNQSSQARVFRNIVHSTGGNYGIYIYRSENCDVINNTVTNTIRGSGLAVINSSTSVINNLIYLNDRNGLLVQNSNPNLSSNCIWNNRGNDYNGIEPANTDISEDPALDQNYVPTEGSPVIDEGDQRYRDPDDTRSDIGARFFNQNFAPEIQRYWPENPDILDGDVEQEFGVEATDADHHQLSYTWFINGEISGEGSVLVHTFTRDGIYEVTVVVDDGFYLGQVSVAWNFVVEGSNISDLYDGVVESFNLSSPYPNPFNGSSTFILSAQTNGIANVSLIDLNGRSLIELHQGAIKSGQHMFTISSVDLPAGTFIVRAEKGGKTELKKIVVLK